MEGSTLSNIFVQTLSRYGIAIAVLTIIIFAAVALFAYYAKNKIDVMRQEATSHAAERVQELNAREATRIRESSAHNADRQTLMDEVKTSREQFLQHMARDSKEKDRLTRTLGSMVAEIRSQVKVLDGIRATLEANNLQSERRIDQLHVKLDEMHRDVARGDRS